MLVLYCILSSFPRASPVLAGMAVFENCSVLLELKTLPFKEKKKVKSAITENGGNISFVVNKQVGGCGYFPLWSSGTNISTQVSPCVHTYQTLKGILLFITLLQQHSCIWHDCAVTIRKDTMQHSILDPFFCCQRTSACWVCSYIVTQIKTFSLLTFCVFHSAL